MCELDLPLGLLIFSVTIVSGFIIATIVEKKYEQAKRKKLDELKKD